MPIFVLLELNLNVPFNIFQSNQNATYSWIKQVTTRLSYGAVRLLSNTDRRRHGELKHYFISFHRLDEPGSNL